LTYIGIVTNRTTTKEGKVYYRCNGKQGARGLYGERGQRCPSKDVSGRDLEALIWADVEGFLRNPGSLVEQLRAKLASEERVDGGAQQLELFERSLREKAGERAKILGLFRRGRIADAELDQQLNEIGQEEQQLQQAIDALTQSSRNERELAGYLRSAEELLGELRKRLDGEVSWELKRQLLEIFIGHVKVDTIQNGVHKESAVTVTYRFPVSAVTCTDTRACNSLTVQKALALPQHRGELPECLITRGDHIRKKG
jgi:site-specific DNA recombinase